MNADRLTRWTAFAAVLAVAAVAAWISYRHAVEIVTAHGETGAVGRLYPVVIDGLIVAASMVLLDAARHREAAPRLAWWLLAAGIGATLAANVLAGVPSGWLGAIVAAWPAAAFVGCYELLMMLVRASARRGGRAHPDPELLLTDARTGLYRLYGEDGELLYVGVSYAPQFRFYDHARLKEWWSEVRHKSVEWLDSRDEAFAAERAAIEAEQPKYNIRSGTVPFVPEQHLNGSGLHPAEAAPFAEDLARGEVPAIRRIRDELHVGQPKAQEIQARLRTLIRTP